MDLEKENRKLRQQLIEFRREAQRSQVTLERYHARELELMSADSLAELLHILTEGLLTSFGVDAIQVLLTDPDHEIRLLLSSNGISEAAFPHLRFVDDLVSINPRYSRLYSPWLGPFLSPEYDGLFDGVHELKSIAVLPLYCRNQLVGSINLGSMDSRRFTRHHATDFLARLGKICGVCLENTINRERLLISGLTDPLTELHNRRYLDRRLNEELSRASRYHQPLSCLFIDADHFKRINDSFGHQAGDSVLRELASRIRSQLRASDVATRYGGEEFCLILPGTGKKESVFVGERIRRAIETESFPGESHLPLGRLTISIGVAAYPSDGGTADELIHAADLALYSAKAQGRNRLVLYDPSLGNQALLSH